MKLRNVQAWWLIGLAVIMGLGGCNRIPTDEKGAVLIYQAPRSAVLAVVGGERITAGDYFDRQSLEAAFFRLNKNPKANLIQDPNEETAKSLERMKSRREGTLLAEMINQEFMRRYLAKSGKSLTSARRQELVAATLKKMKYGGTLVDLAKSMGVSQAFVEAQMCAYEEQRLARTIFDPECEKVSEEQIAKGLKQQEQYKNLAMASNAVTFVTCSNLVRRVQAGESFAELGKTHGFEPHEAEEWDTLRHDEFTNKEFERWAFSATIGSVGGPFELDDSIGIFKILERQDGMTAPSMAAAEVASVRLARIGFPVIDPEPEPRTPEFVRGVLLDWKRKEAQKQLQEKMRSEISLEYPHGSKFTYEAAK